MPARIRVASGPNKVCQLTGEWDREAGVGALNRTTSRFEIVGTDLGSSFHDGSKLWFLFGDTWPDAMLGDAVAWTEDSSATGGLRLQFVVGADGRWKRPQVTVPPGVKAVTTKEFEVPTAGFAVNGQTYIVYTTCHRTEEYIESGVTKKRDLMGRSVVCRARGGDPTELDWLYDLSRLNDGGKFINVSAVVTNTRLPFGIDAPVVLVWGSGRYRDSDVYLAAVPAAEVERRDAWLFYSGTGWSSYETDAKPVVVDRQVGELSVIWVAPLGSWLMAYNRDRPLGIVYRTAPQPWGPWSSARVLYDPSDGKLGYGRLMHVGWEFGGRQGTDALYDRGRGEAGGGPYAPYFVDRFTSSDGQGGARLYFTLSTWNPYQVNLMTATLREVSFGEWILSVVSSGVASALRGDGLIGRWLERIAAGLSPARWLLPRLQDVRDGLRTRSVRPAGLALIQSRFGTRKQNFELVIPARDGGLSAIYADNDGFPPKWGPAPGGGRGPDANAPVHYQALAMIQSSLPTRDDASYYPADAQLIVAAVSDDRVLYLRRDAKEPFAWHGPFPVIAVEPDDRRVPLTGVRGNAALIASTFGSSKRNWELLVPDAIAGIRHYWADNDPGFPLLGDWRTAPTFARDLGRVDAVTLIQSNLGTPDFKRWNLEVVTRAGDALWFLWRDAAGWHGPYPLVADNRSVGGIIGIPSLIQSHHGAKQRNFELVTPIVDGGIAHYWRDNDTPASAWHGPILVDGTGRYQAVSLIQGPFGQQPGNLELAAAHIDGRVTHFWRDTAHGIWRPGSDLPTT